MAYDKVFGKCCKQMFTAIEDYKNSSGTHWDNEHGAKVKCTADAQVFSEYVAVRSHC